MSAATTLEKGRLRAAQLRPDTGRILRPSSSAGVVDDTTSRLTRPPPVEVFAGPCRVKIPTIVQQRDIFGDEVVTSVRFVSEWAWDIPLVELGDVVEIAAAVYDPRITVRRFKVVAVGSKSYLIFRTLGMEVHE